MLILEEQIALINILKTLVNITFCVMLKVWRVNIVHKRSSLRTVKIQRMKTDQSHCHKKMSRGATVQEAGTLSSQLNL